MKISLRRSSYSTALVCVSVATKLVLNPNVPRNNTSHAPKTIPCKPTAQVIGALREPGSTIAGPKPASAVAVAIIAIPI